MSGGGSDYGFAWPDYLVFVLSLVVSCGIGVYYGYKGRHGSTEEEYLMAGRNMGVIPIAISLFVSFLSAITFLSDPVEVYYRGSGYMAMVLGYITGLIILAHTAGPMFHKANITSAYEFLEQRMGKTVRYVGIGTQLISSLIYLGIALFAPSLAISHASGLDVHLTVVLVSAVSTFYTTAGGLRAVVWVDTAQSVLMVGGLLAILIQATISMGGPRIAWTNAYQSGRINSWSFDLNIRGSFWDYYIGGLFRVLSACTTSQFLVMRYCTLPKANQVTTALWLVVPMFGVVLSMICMLGLIMSGYYLNCDPMTSGRIDKHDQVLSLFVLEVLQSLPGLPGLFISCISSAALSTISSGQNGLAVNLLKDVVQPLYRFTTGRELNSQIGTKLAMLFSLLSGVVIIAMAMMAMYLKQSIFTMSYMLTGCISGPVACLFFIAAVAPYIGTECTLIGAFLGLIVPGIIAVGTLITKPPIRHLSFTTTGCSELYQQSQVTDDMTNMTSSSLLNHTAWAEITTTDMQQTLGENIVYDHGIYSISPLYYTPLGCIVTISTAFACYGIKKLVFYIQNKKSEKHLGIENKNTGDEYVSVPKDNIEADLRESNI